MNGEEFKNIFQKENPPQKRRITMLNIGQILLICFLFAVILMQTSGIMSDSSDLSQDPSENQDLPPIKNPPGANQNDVVNPSDSTGGDRVNTNINNSGNNDINKSSEVIFILGENKGKLAVLSPDGQTVYETYDVYISTLPDYDKNLLLSGIKIRTAEELRSLLEDYSS